jgi:hypothetical protein
MEKYNKAGLIRLASEPWLPDCLRPLNKWIVSIEADLLKYLPYRYVLSSDVVQGLLGRKTYQGSGVN